MRDDEDLDRLDDEIRELERELEHEIGDMPGSDREDLQRAPHIGYLTLLTEDVGELAEFYEALFGFSRSYEGASTIELQAGQITLMISERSGMEEVIGVDPPLAGPFPRSSCSFLVEDVDRCFEAAMVLGGEALKPPHDTDWGMRSCWLRDPSGHLLEIGRWIR